MSGVRAASLLLSAALLAQLAAGQARRGSIYDPDLGPQGPISNKTAARVGDLVTILISENQDVRNEEVADLQKETNLRYAIDNFDIAPNAFDVLPELEANSNDKLKGTANYSKRGQFNARLTAVVVDVLPNGNLVVQGRREIRVDKETKVIEISGLVRRWDVASDNTVESELVADAKIVYAGKGPLTDSTNRKGAGGWVHDALAWLWPF